MTNNMVNSEEENFSEERLRKIDVHELLPQQEPFIMIGSLVHFDKLLIITEMEVRESNIFVDDGYFSPSGLMENIAQTCAARIGFVNKYIYKSKLSIPRSSFNFASGAMLSSSISKSSMRKFLTFSSISFLSIICFT